jgi:hypothetical protein
MLRTEVRGDLGDVCGRRRGDVTGVPEIAAVPVKVLVGVKVFENVSVNVLAKVLGLWYVSSVLVRVSVRVSVADIEVNPLNGGESSVEIGTDADDAEETEELDLVFVGEADLDPYPGLE